GIDQRAITPPRRAAATASVRRRAPSLAYRWARCVLTVFAETPSSRAISLLLRPSASRSRTCRSRGLSKAGAAASPAGGEAGGGARSGGAPQPGGGAGQRGRGGEQLAPPVETQRGQADEAQADQDDRGERAVGEHESEDGRAHAPMIARAGPARGFASPWRLRD